ncbi:uncharacterized protein LOC112684465 [Sipha flava]|uniref:Uncharacterized protein LOC112684465 n=1 Tax=Sipha flava TaxID=143950 RepID=A0A2S2QB22_9HEMI|nr:uncharacterized protein LOC112684465 [Sipha flava]
MWYGSAGFRPRDISKYNTSPRLPDMHAWLSDSLRQMSNTVKEIDENYEQRNREEIKQRMEQLKKQKRNQEKIIQRKLRQNNILLQRRYYDQMLHWPRSDLKSQ